MEHNREQIIKALEWCSSLRLCVDCPMRAEGYFSHSGNACRTTLMKNALSLIKELTQANEQLSESYDHLEKTKDELLAERSRLIEDNEDLKRHKESVATVCNRAKEHYDALYEEAKDILIAETKVDTVRKMQERLEAVKYQSRDWSYGRHPWVVEIEDIDQIAKEMVEDVK